jgi:hypothetical protein
MQFREWLCEIRKSTYYNGRTALTLVDSKTGDSIAYATVNLPDEFLEPNQVFIKDYSENRGMLEALEKAGIVKATGEIVRSGYAEVPKATLLVDFEKLLDGKAGVKTAAKDKGNSIER